MIKIDKGDIDILIISEGTFPYVRGGVSSWINQLILGLPNLNFGVVFLGSQKSEYEGIKYDIPDNLVYLYVDYLFEAKKVKKPRYMPKQKGFEAIKELHKTFTHGNDIPHEIKDLDFYDKVASLKTFLFSESSWEFIQEQYLEHAKDESFIDYFWGVKNMHTPIWKLVEIAKNIKPFKIVHSPSTGYAGFLASLLKLNYNKPFILTEHGIYIRERKIDMLNNTWLASQKTIFQKKLGEIPYAKELWIKFFEGIGKFTYKSADEIISLFEGARKLQLAYGADENKTKVIPNGIDTTNLSKLIKEEIPPIITLIGRVVPIKDIKTFIKAMRIAINEIPELEGWIVGPEDEDKDYAKECHLLVESLGLKDKVKFLGFQNINDILPKSGILTLSSISEGMPLVVIEGFAAGLPCVATDVGSCSELIYGGNEEDKKLGPAGEVVKIANPDELAKGYIKLFGNKEYYKQCKDTAIKRVNTYYTKELFLDSYMDIYKEYLWQE